MMIEGLSGAGQTSVYLRLRARWIGLRHHRRREKIFTTHVNTGHRIATSTGSEKHDDDPLNRRLLTASAAADNSQMTCSGGALEEEAGELQKN